MTTLIEDLKKISEREFDPEWYQKEADNIILTEWVTWPKTSARKIVEQVFTQDQVIISRLAKQLMVAIEGLEDDCFCEYSEGSMPLKLYKKCIYCEALAEIKRIKEMV